LALFTLHEILDIFIMTVVIGYIFKDIFPRRPRVEVLMPDYDPLAPKKMFRWNDFWFAVAIIAPSIILHEFGHKFVAIANGMSATFHAPISIQHILSPGLIFQDFAALLTVVVIIMKYFGIGFIFIIPAYTSIAGSGSALQFAMISFAGPALNLVLWLGTAAVLKNKKLSRKIKGETYHLLFMIKRINMFLFIFNMLPIPGFDGWSFFANIFQAIF
jgi:membrane-associated protease RseP (regulator of RpoE activity)